MRANDIEGSIGKSTTGTVNASHTYLQPGTFTATVAVTDDDTGAGTGTLSVAVVAHSATITAATLPTTPEGKAASFSATFTDVDPGDTHTAMINWGNGSSSSGVVTYANGVGTVSANHVYADDKTGNYTAVLTLTDQYGQVATKSNTAVITNVVPTLIAGAATTGTAGKVVAVFLGTFSDPGFTFAPAGTQETFTATVNWGDGVATESAAISVTQGTAGTLTKGTVSGTHTFTQAGTYTVTTTVTDDDGGTASVSTQTVAIAGSVSTKFFVVDQSEHATFRYGADGKLLGEESLGDSGNRSPRGVATNATGDIYWVITTNRTVLVNSADGKRLGEWDATGISNPSDITTNGTDLWISDDSQDRVYRFAGAAARRSGTQSSTSNFALASANKDSTGLVTDGKSMWVTDRHGNDERVFVYSNGGTYQGYWNLDPTNSDPSGIALNLNGGGDLWVVDRHDAVVYRYANSRTRLSGSQLATDSFALTSDNGHPEGIADPGPTPIAIGQAYTPAFAAPSEILHYQLDVTDDTVRYALDRRDGNPTIWSRVLDANNQVIFDTDFNDGDWGTFPVGTYFVDFGDIGSGLSSFEFTVLTAESSTSIVTGANVEGYVPDLYDFGAVHTIAGTTGQQLFFDAGTSNGFFSWKLFDPNGRVLFSEDLQDRSTVILDSNGNYTLRVTTATPEGGGDPTGGVYRFH